MQQKKIYRHIDVCLNRIQEGLRVIEEQLRFFHPDIKKQKLIKDIRHSIRNLFEIEDKLLLCARDSINDNGFLFKGKHESVRKNQNDISKASFKRVTETLRILEEYAKLDFLVCNYDIENIRRQMYQLEKDFFLNKWIPSHPLYPITPTTNIVKYCQQISRISEFIQLRMKTDNKKLIIQTISEIKKSCPNLKIIINDHIDICLSENLNGVHLGQTDLPLKSARNILGENTVIGISTHNLEQALEAANNGADYIGFGPLFYTDSKNTGYQPRGLEMLKLITKKVQIPVYAIGGINTNNIKQAIEAKAQGVAIISAFADNPYKSFTNFMEILDHD